MSPRILLYPHIKYDKDGPVTVFATFISPDPFREGQESRVNREITLPQPAVWALDDDLLAAVQASYPSALVDWHPQANALAEDEK
jgi:hypothetical protein